MAADLQHTLINLEVTPPPGAWDTIVSRLDTEFDEEEIKISQKITDFELAPPTAAWANIEAGMVDAAPVISINRSFRKWIAAAAAVVVLALGGWYFIDNSAVPDSEMTVVPQVKTEEKTNVPEVKNESSSSAAATVTYRPLPRRRIVLAANMKEIEPVSEPEINDYYPHTGMRYIQSASASPTVEAPPIRDANGNIIMDKELIFASDNNYIVVTGPNGEQTRISSKFLPLLNSLNSNNETNDYFQIFLNENNIWKLRFNEWRDKMLRQATFIPTATNLLDILELKDILQEN